MRLLRFAYALSRPGYLRSRNRYDAVDDDVREMSRDVAPALRARLRTLREQESRLEDELRGLGIDVKDIGPQVRPGWAVDPTPRPGEDDPKSLTLPRLPARESRTRRLLRRLGRR